MYYRMPFQVACRKFDIVSGSMQGTLRTCCHFCPFLLTLYEGLVPKSSGAACQAIAFVARGKGITSHFLFQEREVTLGPVTIS